MAALLILLFCNYVSYAEVLRNLTWHEYHENYNKYDFFIETNNNICRIQSLNYTNSSYYDNYGRTTSQLCPDFVCDNRQFQWGPDTDSTSIYCFYWNTDILTCRVSEDIHTYNQYVTIPDKMIDESGHVYTIKYFTDHNDLPFFYSYFLISNSIESFWGQIPGKVGGTQSYKNKALLLSADTLVVGTSIRGIPTFGGCNVLLLKAGIPYHYSDLIDVSSLFEYKTWQKYTNTKVPICSKIHIPRGFRKYYSALDTISGVKLIDDLPVVLCSEIIIRKTITQGGYTYNGKPTSLDYYVDIPESTIQIAVGDTLRLDILCEPYDATVRYSAKMSSSDTTIAKVDSLATVTGLSEGTATITATALDGSGVTSSITVNVSGYNTSVSSLPVRQENRTKSTYYDLYGKAIPYPTTKGLYINNGKKVFITDK